MKKELLLFHPFTREWFGNVFSKPSPPQETGWPSIASGKHTLILAPTGSGKTLAAFLWSIDQLIRLALDSNPDEFTRNTYGVHTLYISPLKALNNDIQRNLKQPLKGITLSALQKGVELPEIRTAVRSGDTPSNIRQSMLNKPPHILITTPESLYLLLTSEKGRELFRNLKYLIVDEIHAISGNKRGIHLSLSIERLMHVCDSEPVRIGLSATQKPLERIAAYLGGQQFRKGLSRPVAREVNIVDCGQRKSMDVQVISPVKEFTNLPDDSVWEPVYELLYSLIRQHTTTLVFTNMRAQTERIARNLNELHKSKCGDDYSEIVLAHHGSISREARYDIEQKLKDGKIPAVIATASLELGIDIGSIDLVVHLESPRSVSGALQRVGRSGHLLSATSRGIIIPLFQEDFDDAIALVRAMYESEIEETVIPENALDVLAQQIVAEVAMKEWSYDELYNLVRQSYCYRNLTRNLFDNVLDMLTGKYADGRIHFLSPRITWDKINNRLIPRKGARLISVLNGGTIPDRGYYGVYLKDESIRLGEVEEEFVNETKVGESFFLGNSEWRLDTITSDRIIVTPVAAIKPKAPFWKGDLLYREYSSSQTIGAFRQEVLTKSESGEAVDWMINECHTSPEAAENLIKYFNRQKERAGAIATHREFIGEWTMGGGGEPIFIFHAPVGGRINGLWVMAVAAAIEKRYGAQVQYAFNDNGFLLRFIETSEEPPMSDVLRMRPDDAVKYVEHILPESPVFAVHFRYNAARALILPKSQADKRIPLWLQRLRASDLMQTVSDFPEFPILLETYRDVTHDLFDIQNLMQVLQDIQEGKVAIKIVHTGYPSPMASGLIFKFVATAIYEYDQSRRAGQTIQLDKQLLDEFYSGERKPTVITKQIARDGELWWQHLVPRRFARSVEDLFNIICELEPISETELTKRVEGFLQNWLIELQEKNRIKFIDEPLNGWICTEDQDRLFGQSPDAEKSLLLHYFQSHGPVTKSQLVAFFHHIPLERLKTYLEALISERKIINGSLISDSPEIYWCDLYNFHELYRRAIGLRRNVQNPADFSLFNRFLFRWHGIESSTATLDNILERYNGYSFPLNFFEREIIMTRISGSDESKWIQEYNHFCDLIADGEFNVKFCRKTKDGIRYLKLYKYGSGNFFNLNDSFADELTDRGSEEKALLEFLKNNGASRIKEIELGLGWSVTKTRDVLINCLEAGFISSDEYENLLTLINREPAASLKDKKDTFSKPISAGWMSEGRSRCPSRSEIRKRVLESGRLKEGRWYLLNSLAVLGKEADHKTIAEFQARLLLNRYGILVKEWYRRENGLLPWYEIFQVLKKLEWQGEIRRGYFVSGLSGIQFATPEALELLEHLQKEEERNSAFVVLSTLDPVLPLGGLFKNNTLYLNSAEIQISRGMSNHLIFSNGEIAAYSELYGRRLWILKEPDSSFVDHLILKLKDWLKLPGQYRPKAKIEIELINNKIAAESEYAKQFILNGFESNNQILVLWPTNV